VDEALYLSDRILLMTDGPEARVGRDLPMPFGRPRSRAEVFAHPQYLSLRAGIRSFLEDHSKQFQSDPSAHN
jgi:ABC-type nitrate/sulfonate/bicarbonate transport system ATPase subunit